MQPSALRTLEFDRIVEAVSGFALTPMGAECLAALEPSTDAQKVAQLLAATTETMRFVTSHGLFPLRASSDLPQVLAALAVEGRALEPLRLLALAAFLDSVDESRAAIRRAPGSFPILEAASSAAASFKVETGHTREKIEPSGEVVDDASPTLKGIRERLRKQRTRLRSTLESYLRGKETSKYLQDQVVTERNGRYVLVVKAEHRSGIPGIVHGTSTSGASLFLEPLSTVEINNDIVALEEQEAEEVRRILLALTDAFRQRAGDMQRTIEAATELDVLQARARFSNSIDGIEPVLSTDGAFELQAARHPLLKSPVPVTIKVIPPATILLVTGPNTGGKTVALKTAGLLAVMAQAGLRIPAAEGSRLPVFRSLFADIGDEQSIEASLSTFSAHITNSAAMDRGLATPALVLLDEVGSGTDPIEGGALGVAIIDHFRQRGAVVAATTHYETIKSYATSTAGVTCAAFGFEPATFAPTYRLIYGSPGGSLAFEIAARLGLPRPVLDAAHAWRSDNEVRLSEQMAKLDRELQSLDHERRLTTQARAQAEASERQLRAREDALREREAQFTRKLEQRLNEQLRDARAEVDKVVADLRQQAAALEKTQQKRVTPIPTGVTGDLRVSARAALDSIADRVREGGAPLPSDPVMPPTPEAAGPLAVGDRVEVGVLRLQGVVRTLAGKDAEVDVNGKRMRVKLAELRKIGGAATSAAPTVNVRLAARSEKAGSGHDLNVVGCTVDEAIDRADKFLDEAAMQELRTVRVIHGHGTGRLRQALSGYLNAHPLVLRAAPAPNEMGGGAVTLVELRD